MPGILFGFWVTITSRLIGDTRVGNNHQTTCDVLDCIRPALRLAFKRSLRGPLDTWQRTRDENQTDIFTNFWTRNCNHLS